MIIDCIADLHGYYPKLDGGDLLIIAGDLTRSDAEEEYKRFDNWLYDQKYGMKILVAGNHDNRLMVDDPFLDGVLGIDAEYLCDSGIEFEGLKIWGSPWTKRFKGMNPKCMAFTVDTDEELAEKWKLVPEGIDILITHCAPAYMLDRLKDEQPVGSYSLTEAVRRIDPTLHVFGHIHESYGYIFQPAWSDRKKRFFVNASHVNEHYEPVNKPIRIEL